MTLTELLMGLNDVNLKDILREYAVAVHGFPRNRDVERNIRTGSLKRIAKAITSGDKEVMVSCIEQLLSTYNNTKAQMVLKDLGRSDIPIKLHEHTKLALFLCFIPTPFLEKTLVNIALERDSPLPDTSNELRVLAEVASLIEDKGNNSPSHSSLCPHCEKGNPIEADHCIYCGGMVRPPKCTSCKSENPPQAKFCMFCAEIL